MKRVLVIGDAIADVYRTCTFKKYCPEDRDAPAMVQKSRELLPGGAANVAVNLAALGHDLTVDLIAVLDKDLAKSIKNTSRNLVRMDYSFVGGYPLTKERIVMDDELQVRVDNALEINSYDREMVRRKLKEYLADHAPDLILMSDYGSGTIDDETLEILLNYKERLVVDTKRTDLSVFGDVARTLICKLNEDEFNRVRLTDTSPARHFEYLIVTTGSDGADVIIYTDLGQGKSREDSYSLEGFMAKTVDVNGCGDTFLAALGSALVHGVDTMFAVSFANAAASTVVSQQRTAVADLDTALKLVGTDNETWTGRTGGDRGDPPPRTD